MHLAAADQVDAQVPLVQCEEYVHEEAVCARALVAVHVEDDDVMFDGDGGWALGTLLLRQQPAGAGTTRRRRAAGDALHGLCAEELRGVEREFIGEIACLVGQDERPAAARVHDVFYAYWYACIDNLLHCERMDDLSFVSIEV